MVIPGVLILLLIGTYASIPNLDYDSLVYISPGGTAFMTITSNPSTGYWWILEQNHSEKLSVKDYLGEYTSSSSSSTDIAGAPGIQTFEIHCDETSSGGDEFDLHFILKRS